jgi:hypothetical protein
MTVELLIKMGGIYHLICAILHIFFPRIPQWDNHLKDLANDSRLAIKQSLHIMNLCIMVFWLILAYIPFFHVQEILTTPHGKTLLTSIVLFWIVRIFILQPVFIGIKSKESWQMIIFFIPGLILF